MNDFERFEYVITPQKSKKNAMARFLLIVGYVFFIIGWLFFGLLTKIFVPLLALIPLSTWFLVFATWRYVNVEYEYVIESGTITFTKIYGGKSRKMILVFDIRDAERILPLGEAGTRRALDDFDPMREYFFAKSEDAEDSFLALYTDEDDARLAISFTAEPRLLKLLRLYNASAMNEKGRTY